MTTLRTKRPKKKSTLSDFRWLLGNLFSLLRRFGREIIWVGLLAYCAHLMGFVLVAYAGKTSNANLALRMAANLNVAVGISITATGISIGLYFRERKLHRATRERLSARITSLELKIDPTRTSSRLTSEGLTRKEDL